MKNFKRPVFGTAVLALLSLSSVSAFADGAPSATVGDYDTEVLRYEDGALEIKPGKIQPSVGYFKSNQGSSGLSLHLDAEKNLVVGGEEQEKLDWNSQSGGVNSYNYEGTIRRGLSISPRLNADLQLRIDGDKNQVEKYEVRGSFLEGFARNRVLRTDWNGSDKRAVKTSNVTFLHTGGRIGEDKRLGNKTLAAELSPVTGTVDRAWENANNGNTVRVCGAFKPVTFLAGKNEMLNEHGRTERSALAVEMLDASLCTGVSLGQKGGEIRVTGEHVMRMNLNDGRNTIQNDVTGKLTYSSAALSGRKIHVLAGGEVKATLNRDADPVIVGQGTVGAAF